MRSICLFRAESVSLIVSLLCAAQSTATGPSLSGSVVANFTFIADVESIPGDQSYWAWSGATGSLSLAIPSTIDHKQGLRHRPRHAQLDDLQQLDPTRLGYDRRIYRSKR